MQKRSCGLQVLKHLLSDPLLKKKKSLSLICFLLKMRKLKPKETKDLRVIQLVFGRGSSKTQPSKPHVGSSLIILHGLVGGQSQTLQRASL